MTTPVVLVHGIWDDGKIFEKLTHALEGAGKSVDPIDLVPPDGSRSIALMAEDVGRAVARAEERAGGGRVDLLGFSMGALVSRFFIQRGGGKRNVRRFVSISGPHEGTVMGAFGWTHAARQMRRGSALVRELAADQDPYGDVEVFAARTPYDLMIVPSRSSVIPRAKENRTFDVPLHGMMVNDARVIRWVVETLSP
jgi:triacylglycerol esterase/lipase EstA (alpha/beta hydrolase family)